jgi:urease accessory protein
MTRTLRHWAAVTPVAAMLPTAALAHGNLPGTGGFAAGFAHPFIATEQTLVLIATGLMLGSADRRLPLAFLLAGLAAGLALSPLPEATARLLALFAALAAGAAVALASAIPLAPAGAAALLAGAAVGVGTDLPGPDAALAATLPAAAGVAAGVMLIVLNAMAFARCRLGRGLGRRIGGSWIAAAAMMLLAFFLYGAPGAA